MYVHISASPEKFLKQISLEKVSRYGTLFICFQKLQEKKRGQGGNFKRLIELV